MSSTPVFQQIFHEKTTCYSTLHKSCHRYPDKSKLKSVGASDSVKQYSSKKLNDKLVLSILNRLESYRSCVNATGFIQILFILHSLQCLALLNPTNYLAQSLQESSDKHKSGQCPSKSWVSDGDSCLRFHSSAKNLENAKSKCKDFESQLVYIDDVEKHERISDLLAEKHEVSKQYYVKLSDSLFTTYQTSDFSDPSVNDIWLPRNDASLGAILSTLQKPEQQLKDSFVYAFSQNSNRWGLVPIEPSVKASFICERLVKRSTSSEATHSTHNQPNHQQHGQTNVQQGVNLNQNSGLNLVEPKGIVDKETASSEQQSDAGSSLFREIPQDQKVILGSTAEMRCSPIDAKSNVVWSFKSSNLTSKGRIEVHSNGTLKLGVVRNTDVGTYTCSIYTSNGASESRSSRLEIIELPHPPEYIAAELLDKTSLSVRLKWTPGFNGNSPITKYTVEMKTVDGIDGKNEVWEVAKTNISADHTSIVIPNLKPARKYIFRVRSSNKVGTGLPSNPTKEPIEVPVQPPSSPPENIVGNSRSSTSIQIQWSPPNQESQNGVIKGYKIRHKLAGYSSLSDVQWSTHDVSDATQHTLTLDDLIVWRDYEIQIAAENDKGVGPFSQSIIVRTKEGKPDHAPRNVVAEPLSSKSVKALWDPPPPQDINGINLGYKVHLYSDPQLKHLLKESVVSPNAVPSSTHSAIFDELMPYTSYYITVLCFTSAGDGPANENAVVVRTKEDLPDAVSSIEFADVLDKSLRIMWKPPLRTNGELKHYTLECYDSSENKILKTFNPHTLEARFTDLESQSQYKFKLFAHTSVGPGPARVATITTSMPPILPEPPTSLNCTNVGSNNVTIAFSAGHDGNAAIEKWIVEAMVSSRPERWHKVYESTSHVRNSNTVVVRNLKPYTRYKFRLIPVNILGPSVSPSEPSPEILTSPAEPEQAPRDLVLDNINSTSLVAKWTPLPPNMWQGPPRGYNLTWTETGNFSSSYSLINDTDASSCTVSDLEEYTEYTFKIFAINEVGSSQAGSSVTITTAEYVPSAGPTNVTASTLSSHAVNVNWYPVERRHRNGIIRGYKIQYQCAAPNSPVLERVIEDNNTRSFNLTDLRPYSTYHLAISAFTSMGEGVYSNVVNFQTFEDTPSMPMNLSVPTTSQNSARILWDPPEEPNGDILGYKVSYHPLSEGPKESISHELPPNDRTFKATNLKPDLHYAFTVTAKTREGWGPQASTLVYTYDSELRANLPFYHQSWFVILTACATIVITIIVVVILYVRGKSYKYKQDAMKTSSHDRLGEAGFSIDGDLAGPLHNDFGLTTSGAHQKRSNSLLSHNSAYLTMPKIPQRPHASSVVYSDDYEDEVFEETAEKTTSRKTTSAYDSSDDSLPEKPSMSSSTGPGSESADEDYVNTANRTYANVNGTLRNQRQAWKKGSANKYYNTSKVKEKMQQRAAPVVPHIPGTSSQMGGFNSSGSSNYDTNAKEPMQSCSNGMSNNAFTSSQTTLSDNMNPQYSNHNTMQSNSTDYSSSRFHNPPSYHEQAPMSSSQAAQNMNQSNANYQTLTHNSQPAQTQIHQNLPHQHNQHLSTNGDNPNTTNNTSIDAVDGPAKSCSATSTSQDLLTNNNVINLNGGRIIVDNMAGSRAPLPGFTSFV